MLNNSIQSQMYTVKNKVCSQRYTALWSNVKHQSVEQLNIESLRCKCHVTSIQKQAVGRLGAGQSAQIIANAYTTLTLGLSTICNIDISPPTAPTIARAVVIPKSSHLEKIALFCANICKTDSPQHLRQLVIPLKHNYDP